MNDLASPTAIAQPVTLSIVLPARNESAAIGRAIAAIRAHCPQARVLVVNDGSTDSTAAVAEEAGATVVGHPYGKGNGAAIKTGARIAEGDVIVFMDADGQHDPADIPRLRLLLEEDARVMQNAAISSRPDPVPHVP